VRIKKAIAQAHANYKIPQISVEFGISLRYLEVEVPKFLKAMKNS
jgi:hypothetical protein